MQKAIIKFCKFFVNGFGGQKVINKFAIFLMTVIFTIFSEGMKKKLIINGEVFVVSSEEALFREDL